MRSAMTAEVRPASRFASAPFKLLGLLAAAFLVRLLFVPGQGFSGDVSTFESWSLTLDQYGTRSFFAHAGFADYPPGYFFILWIVGHVYGILKHVTPDPSYALLKALVKLPAILMDLVDAWLVYAMVKRFTTQTAALVAAAIFAFDPSIIFISAYWGQVDSVATGFTLGAILMMMRAYDAGRHEMAWIVNAWATLAYSLLIKPPSAVLIPIFIAFIFVGGRAAIARRAVATGYGILAALAIAYVGSLVFHAGFSPVAQFEWLIGRYAYASNVYPYDSVNAFNLYAVFLHFWSSDTILVPQLTIAGHIVGITRVIWGAALVLIGVALIVSRYVTRKDAPALLEATMLASFAFFMLATRMHERYVFNALALAIPLAFYRRRYLYATVVLTVTLFANLVYSLAYLKAVGGEMQGVDATDIMPLVSRPLATLNVLTFFYLGYVFLGSTSAEAMEDERLAAISAWFARTGASARAWFAPIEGVAHMTGRDWLIGGGLAFASFALTFVNYWWPSEKIFDEIYYARAGEEYLTHANVNGFGVFEFTHPPLTKLVITLSMILFGGMPHGDQPLGWRFLNLVVGAVMVLVCYAFAKRLLGSTPFATIAAGSLLFDGFHYVQSRIATPEITVAFFTLLTLYCFYRFWIASQVRIFPQMSEALAKREALFFAGGTVVAIAAAWAITQIGPKAADGGPHEAWRATLLAFVYFELGIYTAIRLFVPRIKAFATPDEVSFADGTRIVGGATLLPEGVPGATGTSGQRRDDAEGLRITYGSPALTYATPDGEATFVATPGSAVMEIAFPGDPARGIARIRETLSGDSPQRWMLLLALSSACLASCKWNGLFDFFVIWGCAGFVVSQPYWSRVAAAFGGAKTGPANRRPALYGNPFGISLDVLVTSMLFVAMTIYTLCYIPFFSLGKTLDDLIGLQQQMYWYHANLKATHPYGSSWWQWPILQRPISYYYHDFRSGAALQNAKACCVAEILALPNPLVWWSGLVSVPALAYFAWRERSKGFTLLVSAYVLQWLPWIISPRVAFEYHFFPNLAIICLANAVLLQRVWRLGTPGVVWPKVVVYGYAAGTVAVFAFFYPVLAGLHVPWNVWDARMLHPLMGSHWV